MVNTRKSSQHESCGLFISSRTRSSAKNNPSSDEQHHKDPGSDVSSSSARLSPPRTRTRRHTTPSSSDTSPSPQVKGQRVTWNIPAHHTRLSTEALQNGHGSLSRKGQRKEDAVDGEHARMNGHVELKRSCRSRKSRFEHLNQSRLFDQLVNSTAEAVLQEMENMDMYSRVKRRRKSLRRNAYGMQTHHKVMSKGEGEEEEGTEESHEEEEEDDDDEVEDDEDDEDEAEEVGDEVDCEVKLREAEATPLTYLKQSKNSLFDTHRSPARRSHIRVKKHAIHSSDTTSSSDEERFERRKSKSMTRAKPVGFHIQTRCACYLCAMGCYLCVSLLRCLPMNLRPEDLASGVLRDRVKVGASLADVDPMNLDTSVRFDSVGGLGTHIQALKEMVVFPLLYPEVFEKFKIQPPRGCLFYGPPGTGKTLVARALANECSQGDRKVSFFMRKGADCLSKWVGESERQLRLLFDQAYLMRPSIIFFDEIDGLAPVRSSRQDQIHSSIVSTLLALMDGLDSRGEIVVIGATNRIDSIDPALRRPGRFDREFLFNLPDKKARKHILQIHTREWNPRLAEPFLGELAEKCVGYCGADIKALCTEAALVALRRRYPQIYGSSRKLRLDVESIVRPLLERMLAQVQVRLLRVFPHAELSHADARDDGDNQLLEDLLYSDDEDSSAPSIYDHIQSGSPKKHATDTASKPFLHFTLSACRQPSSFRPRLLLAGEPGSGQSSHLAPAVLHHLEKFCVHRLDLPTLCSTCTRTPEESCAQTPEESCAQVFREARRTVPSVVYLPHISEWWEAVSDTLKSTFLTLLQDLPSFTPILILATSETPYLQLPEEVRGLFRSRYEEVVNLQRPDEEDQVLEVTLAGQTRRTARLLTPRPHTCT
ncbi:hypothetical protein ANANG_G00114190 [Anguilla anguilla]|uniref:AAA+ ATPase domain-containing protein n=1 Tax=Anguilla anguilla TaxID=7936 RepID=A0A9D3MD51_ANGAN|nr:hypothetical protein ANANG_G00114190 [Anguilla anguilla]